MANRQTHEAYLQGYSTSGEWCPRGAQFSAFHIYFLLKAFCQPCATTLLQIPPGAFRTQGRQDRRKVFSTLRLYIVFCGVPLQSCRLFWKQWNSKWLERSRHSSSALQFGDFKTILQVPMTAKQTATLYNGLGSYFQQGFEGTYFVFTKTLQIGYSSFPGFFFFLRKTVYAYWLLRLPAVKIKYSNRSGRVQF